MPRDITTAAATALAQEHVVYAVLLLIDLPTGVLRLCSAATSVQWDGHTWIGGAAFTGLNPIEERSTPSAAGVVVRLSGIDVDYVQDIMQEHYQGRPASIWLATLDAAHQIIADPILVFSGRCDKPSIEMGETATITLGLENRWADWDRPRIRRYNHADQTDVYATDKGLEFVEQMESVEINWGTFKGPPAPKIQIPGWVKQYAVNPYLPVVNFVSKTLRKLF
jgi:hypothetical protein